MSPTVVPPSTSFDWDKLSFGLYPTNGYAKYVWRDGAWGSLEWVTEPNITLPVGAVALNYGASVFEGLKAFRQEDGQVKIFRPDENAKRITYSANFVSMPALPEATFLEGVHAAVGQNLEFVPPHAPYGASGSMYIRPLMFASSAQLGLVAGDEFTFLVYVTPTGSLYGTAGGKAPAVDGVVVQNFDRAAEFGTGTAKLAGNYAPVLRHQAAAVAAGYKITLHLDSKTRSFVDEFSTSNFLAIAKPSSPDATPTLVWPQSESILKSVTTMSLVAIAREKGWNIDLRPIPFSDIVEGVFSEVFACGTAAAITPVRSISYNDKEGVLQKATIGDGETAGPRTLELLAQLTGIQSGVREDTLNFLWPKEGVDAAKVQ